MLTFFLRRSHAEQSSEEAQRANLIDNYLSALLMAFISCGLLEVCFQCFALLLLSYSFQVWPTHSSNKVLVELGKTQDSSARKLDEKALMLLGEILHLSDILMPASQCANIQVTCDVSFVYCESMLIPSSHL
jgi:hypothetical protein